MLPKDLYNLPRRGLNLSYNSWTWIIAGESHSMNSSRFILFSPSFFVTNSRDFLILIII